MPNPKLSVHMNCFEGGDGWIWFPLKMFVLSTCDLFHFSCFKGSWKYLYST